MSQLLASEMRNLTTAQVVLILGLSSIAATVVIWLAIIGADPVEIFSGLAPVLLFVGGAFGWAKVNSLVRSVGEVKDISAEVKDLSNGRLTDLQEANRQLSEKVANLSLLLPPPPTPPPVEEDK